MARRGGLYELSGGQFQLAATLQASCGGSTSFGGSVSLSDDLLAVGDTTCDVVHVYRQVGGAWTLEDSIALGGQFDLFGYSVAIDGEHLAVSNPVPIVQVTDVLTYRLSGGARTDAGVLAGHAEIGPLVELEGTRILTTGGSFPNAQRGLVYEWDGSAWVEIAGLGALPPVSDLDLTGDLAAIGTADGVQLFDRISGTWVEQAALPIGDCLVAWARSHLLLGQLYRESSVDAWLASLEWSSYCAGDGSAGACPCVNGSAPHVRRGFAPMSGRDEERRARMTPAPTPRGM